MNNVDPTGASFIGDAAETVVDVAGTVFFGTATGVLGIGTAVATTGCYAALEGFEGFHCSRVFAAGWSMTVGSAYPTASFGQRFFENN